MTATKEEHVESQRFVRASVVLFGWLPLAIIMFWMSLILTKGIAFVNDDPTPRYELSVFGITQKAALVSIEGEPSNLSLNISVPFGTRFLAVEHVRDEHSCSYDADREPAGQKLVFYSRMYDTAARFAGWQADIAVPTSVNAFGTGTFYGSYSKMLTVRCDVAWTPKQESFAKYDFRITNYLTDDAGVKDAKRYEALGYRKQNVVVSAYKLNESKILTIAGRRTAQEDERDLIPGDFAVVDWNSENGSEKRDALFVVIGAFIAIGAAILIEGLRPHVELAIESNYANSSGNFD